MSVITTLFLCWDYVSSSSVVSRAFSALCVYSKIGHHPHPLGYLCAKFRFFRGLHYWASPWRKSHTRSLTHSPSLFDVPGTEAAEHHCTRNLVLCSATVCLLITAVNFGNVGGTARGRGGGVSVGMAPIANLNRKRSPVGQLLGGIAPRRNCRGTHVSFPRMLCYETRHKLNWVGSQKIVGLATLD